MKRFLKIVGAILGGIVALFIGLVVLAAIFGDGDSGNLRVDSMTAEEKVAKIAELETEIAGLAESDYRKKIRLYKQLSSLDPTNNDYKQKADTYAKMQDQARQMKDHPEKYVNIESFKWWKDGFGSIMMASFTIKNQLPFDIKDIRIKCRHTAASGTVIDQNSETLYEIIRAGGTMIFSEVNMGFIRSQVRQSNCDVVKVIVLDQGR